MVREGRGGEPGDRRRNCGPTWWRFAASPRFRRGETENCLACLGPSSCIFPIAAEAVHQQPAGSREAIRHFTGVPRAAARGPGRPLALERRLHDPGRVSRQGPAGLPDPARAVPLDARHRPVRERRAAGRARRRGARTWPAAASSTTSPATACPTSSSARPTGTWAASLFVNRGDGTFEDRVRSAGLGRPGRGRSTPATPTSTTTATSTSCSSAAAGRALPALAAAERGRRRLRRRDRRRRPGRADRHPVGRLGRLRQRRPRRPVRRPASITSPRHCPTRGTAAGSTATTATARSPTSPSGRASDNDRYAKGAAWGDYDDDGGLDLYVSNMGEAEPAVPQQRRRDLHRRRHRARRDRAARQLLLLVLGLRQRRPARPVRHRLLARRSRTSSPSQLGQPTDGERPRLYRNLGPAGFRDVDDGGRARPRVSLPMGSNFGDIDNDGFLDFYLGHRAGRPIRTWCPT